MPHDRTKYRLRNLVECLCNKLKNWRRVGLNTYWSLRREYGEMAGIKLCKLPDRTPIKFTITVTPDLARALGEYTEAYEAAYGKR